MIAGNMKETENMRSVTLHNEGKEFTLTSFGNGWAYELSKASDGPSLFIQDEAATEFRDALELLERVYDTENALELLWDSYKS